MNEIFIDMPTEFGITSIALDEFLTLKMYSDLEKGTSLVFKDMKVNTELSRTELVAKLTNIQTQIKKDPLIKTNNQIKKFNDHLSKMFTTSIVDKLSHSCKFNVSGKDAVVDTHGSIEGRKKYCDEYGKRYYMVGGYISINFLFIGGKIKISINGKLVADNGWYYSEYSNWVGGKKPDEDIYTKNINFSTTISITRFLKLNSTKQIIVDLLSYGEDVIYLDMYRSRSELFIDIDYLNFSAPELMSLEQRDVDIDLKLQKIRATQECGVKISNAISSLNRGLSAIAISNAMIASEMHRATNFAHNMPSSI